MNHVELLKNGRHTVCEAIDGLTETEWQIRGVVGKWSIKDIIAHLAAYEQMLVDVLNTLLHTGSPTPTLDRFREQYYLAFDEEEVTQRRGKTVAEVMAEYEAAHAQTLLLLPRAPAAVRCEPGVLPWEGSPYDLEDFLIYTAYGHKQEHGAQIAAFRKRLARHGIDGRTGKPASLQHDGSRLAHRRGAAVPTLAAGLAITTWRWSRSTLHRSLPSFDKS